MSVHLGPFSAHGARKFRTVVRGLVIGINRYASPYVDWLSCARRDATARRALFADTFGEEATLLTGAEATRGAIEAQFARLVATASPLDRMAGDGRLILTASSATEPALRHRRNALSSSVLRGERRCDASLLYVCYTIPVPEREQAMNAQPHEATTPDTELDRLLAQADRNPVVIERHGARYRVMREADDIWAGYDPDAVLAGMDAAVGSIPVEEAERFKKVLYEGREAGTRPRL